MTKKEPTSIEKRLAELLIINPKNLECSSCNYYPGWVSGKCSSINPLFFCVKHTGLLDDDES